MKYSDERNESFLFEWLCDTPFGVILAVVLFVFLYWLLGGLPG